MGTGILCYFALRAEPPGWLGAAVAVPAVIAAMLLGSRPTLRAGMMALAAAAIGLASAQFATWRALPLETLPTHATILTGTVRGVEALPEGRRITLESAQLDDAPPLARWLRVRLRANDQADVAAGDTIRVRALVRPPAPPAYPGAWDLQRDAWFDGHGGSGYALGPMERLAETAPAAPLRLVQQLRELIARRITAVVPGPAGAISVTLLTGVTSGIPPADHDAFRASGLAHLLAVAGLHIGIVMGWALAFSRLAFAASEHASLHWPTKKLAALAALAAGGGYMVLTGMHLPIVRSFAMACLYTVAVLAGRRAISLRGLALAATVLMLLEPEEVPGVSFQMSFSAVLALISGYELLRPALRSVRGDGAWRRRFALHLAALALTSFLAGTASAPFGAYHFGRIQVYFVVANMVAVPLTALWAMPAGLIGLVLMPFGLDWLAFIPMGWGVQAILWVARTTAALPAATLDVPHMPPWGLAATALGIAWLGLWRSPMRLVGVPVIVLGLLSPMLVRPPDLMVSADARLIAIRAHGELYFQQTSGASKFTRESWLQVLGGGHIARHPQRRFGGRWCDFVSEGCMHAAATPVRESRAAGAWRVASGRLRRGVGDCVGGTRARTVPKAVAGTGGSLHRLAIWRGRDLAVWSPRIRADGSCIPRCPTLGAAAPGAARAPDAGAADGQDRRGTGCGKASRRVTLSPRRWRSGRWSRFSARRAPPWRTDAAKHPPPRGVCRRSGTPCSARSRR